MLGALMGLNIIVSSDATAEPSGTPHTDDMREMVEHFRELGLIRSKPTAYQTLEGLVVHPAIYNRIGKHIAKLADLAVMSPWRGLSLGPFA